MQTRTIRTVDLFAGIGGFHYGLEQSNNSSLQTQVGERSTGIQQYGERVFREGDQPNVESNRFRQNYRFKCIWANEWDKYAASVYRARFPETPLDTRDIRKVPVEEIPQHDLLCGGFPCFARGTLILTDKGFISIESVSVGDLVLTHRGHWKKVTRTMQRRGRGRLVKGQGILPTITSDEHPYYARTAKSEWVSGVRTHRRRFSEPDWIDAKDLKGKYVTSVLPEPTELEGDTDFWWIVGRYIADGWLVNRNDRGNGSVAKVIICGGKDEADVLGERIRRKFHCTTAPERTVVKFHITNKKFAEFLEPIGRGAGNKQIPPKWFGASREIVVAILDGYLSGDGNKNMRGWSASTISPALALGIVLFAQNSRGIKASINKHIPSPTREIEGRTINQQPSYIIQIPNRNRSAFVNGRYAYGLVRVSLPLEGEIDLFNLEVEDDNSYVANGAIVHNCQSFSVAGRREGFNDTRGTLFREIVRIAEYHRPQLLFLENVKGLLNHDSGRTFGVILEELGNIGYKYVEWQTINTKWVGVPQNRERVFIVGHLGEGCSRAVFPFTEIGGEPYAKVGGEPEEQLVNCIDGNYWKGPDKHGQRTVVEEKEANTDGKALDLKKIGNIAESGHDSLWGRVYDPKGISASLNSQGGGLGAKTGLYQVQPLKFLNRNQKNFDDTAMTVDTVNSTGIMEIANCLDQDGYLRTGERPRDANGKPQLLPIGYRRIRRLTPVECERLQAFPDNWTANGIVDGKVVKISDTQRYKMCGNAVTTQVVTYIGKRLIYGFDSIIPIIPEQIDTWFG